MKFSFGVLFACRVISQWRVIIGFDNIAIERMLYIALENAQLIAMKLDDNDYKLISHILRRKKIDCLVETGMMDGNVLGQLERIDDRAGMGILRIFPHLRIFFFSASNLPHFCGFLQFRALIREREKCGKKCLQNNPNRASERNAEKLLTKIIPNRASPL